MSKPPLAPGFRDLVPRETETDMIAIVAGFTSRGYRRGGPSAVRQMAQIFEDHECVAMQALGRSYECMWELHDDTNLNWTGEGQGLSALCVEYSPEYLGVELPPWDPDFEL